MAARHYQEGEKSIEQKEYQQALNQLNYALTLTPDNPKILNAIKRVKMLIIQAEVEGRTDRAVELLNAGDVDSAKEEIRKALAVIPEESTQKSQ